MAKTRIVVELDGILRELFSIDERKSGDLAIYVKSSAEIDVKDGDDHQEVAEQRFSVHVSPKSRGHTIKQTLRTSLGNTTTSALVLPVKASRKSDFGLLLPDQIFFCWPVFAFRPPRLDTGRYDSKPKTADRIINLGSFNPSRANLIYMVVATSTNVETIPNSRGRTLIESIKFKHFNLHVVYGYSLAPSMPAGDFLTFATSAQLGRGETPSGPRSPLNSLGLPAVEGRFFESIGIFRDRYSEKFVEVEDSELGVHGAAVTMFALSGICVQKPPMHPQDILDAFNDYEKEMAKFSTLKTPGSAAQKPELPVWMEEARKEILRDKP